MRFDNVTVWGKKAEDFYFGKEESMKGVEIACVAEHHKLAQGWPKVRNTLQQNGWRSVASPAKKSMRSETGSEGGTAVMSRSHLHLTPFQDERLGEKGNDWSAIMVRLKGVDLLLISVYLTCSIGMTGENLAKVKELMQLCLNANIPFIMIGDWNMDPSKLMTTGWLEVIKAEIMVPSNVDFTCDTRSMLDYAVVSRSIRGAILGLKADLKTPWVPHRGLIMEIMKAPRAALCRTLIKPRRMDSEIGKDKVVMDKSKAWKEAKKDHEDSAAPDGEPLIDISTTVLQVTKDDAQELAVQYANWSKLAEEALRRAHGIEEAEGTSRGQFTCFKVGPALPRKQQHVVQEASKDAKQWACIIGNLKAILNCRRKKLPRIKAAVYGKELEDIAFTFIEELMNKQDTGEGRVQQETERIHLHLWKIRLACIENAAEDVIEGMILHARKRKETADSKAKWRNQQKVKEWVNDACDGYMKKAHQYIKGHESYHEDNDEQADDGKAKDPIQLMDIKAEGWEQRWYAGKERTELLKKVYENLRKEAQAQTATMKAITVDQTKNAIRTLAERGIGVDWWTVKEMKALPEEAYEELTKILNHIEDKLSFPEQVLLNLIPLLPKPKGGERPIVLANMIYVIWAKIRNVVFKPWDNNRVKHWDDAIKGSSALKAALSRRLLDELQVQEAGFVVGLFWDLEKFFDSIDPVLLIQLATEEGLCRRMMTLAMQIHLAPRFLKAGEYCSGGVRVSRSILAGCKYSIGFARSIVYQIMEQMHKGIGPQRSIVGQQSCEPETSLKQYIDDIAQVTRGKDRAKVVKEAAEVAEELHKRITGQRLKVSDKTTVVASDNKMGQEVQHILELKGMHISCDTNVVDLGMDTVAGKCRIAKTARKMLKKGKVRADKTKWMVKRDRRATKLMRTNVWPTMAYGISGYGASPTMIREMRTIAANAADAKAGHCATTQIALEFGETQDPGVKARLMIVKDWVALWNSHGDKKDRIRKVWAKEYLKMQGPYRWRTVAGPIGATIATLLDINWDPAAPDVWQDCKEGGGKWRLEGQLTGDEECLKQIRESITQLQWKKAAEHHCGKGLQHGSDLRQVRKQIRWLTERDMKGKAGILRAAVTGSMWTRQRKKDHIKNFLGTSICRRCNKEEETDAHRIWRCEKNLTSTAKAISSTNHLAREANGEAAAEEECFWLRGLIPKPWLKVEEPTEDKLTETRGSITPGAFFLDGSGGKNTSDHRVRRCGWAAVKYVLNQDLLPELLGAVYGNVPGPIQTVPRAELLAAVEILRRVRGQEGGMMLYTDCQYVYEGAINEEREMKGYNVALWEELDNLIEERRLAGFETYFQKVKAHCKKEDFWHGTTTWHTFAGNAMADAFAGVAADLMAVPEEEVNKIAAKETLAWRIRDRIVATAQEAIEADEKWQEEDYKRRKRSKAQKQTEGPRKTAAQKRKEKLQELLRQTSHSLDEYRPGKFRCRQCIGARAENQLLAWLSEGPCPCPAPTLTCPIPDQGQVEEEANEDEANEDEVKEDEADKEEEDDPWQCQSCEPPEPWEGQNQEGMQQSIEEHLEEEDVFGHARYGFDNEFEGQELDDDLAEEDPTEPAIQDQELEPTDNLQEDSLEEIARAMQEMTARRRLRQKTQDVNRRSISTIILGKQPIHSTHRLHYKRGIVWCWHCAGYGTEAPKKLIRPCKAELTRGGEGYLRRIARGDTPRSSLSWPLRANEGHAEGPVQG